MLAPKPGQFARDYPDVVLDVTTEESRVDLAAAGFDAGIQFGKFIKQDMVAVRVSPDHQPAIVGAPAYFEAHPKPKSPRDMLNHRCINFRHGFQRVYRWKFDKGKQSLTVAVKGPLIVDDVELLIRAAIDGVSLAFMSDDRAARHLASAALVRVLEDWCPPFPGFFPTIRVGGSNQRRSLHSSRLFGYKVSQPTCCVLDTLFAFVHETVLPIVAEVVHVQGRQRVVLSVVKDL